MLTTVGTEYVVDEDSIRPLLGRLDKFMERYLPLLGRTENRRHGEMYVKGRMLRLDRRTLEPIANENGVHRRALQLFVGAGLWRDGPVLDTLCHQTVEELGSPDGILIMDGSGFPKSGNKSVGVQRQWCGRLGKKENCQVGEFLGYATPRGRTIVDFRLYLPESWAEDAARRKEAHVPPEVEFRKGWELAYEMVKKRSPTIPHRWVVGDDAYGRVTALRDRLAADDERYLLEVPCNTNVSRERSGGASCRVDSIAKRIPEGKWKKLRIRDGEKGPIEVLAAKVRVTTEAEDESGPRRETLLVVKTPRDGKHWYYLGNDRHASLSEMTMAARCRHYVEEALELAKGEVGLAEYEVRSWVGWHHHMTLSLLAMLFLACERNRIKKNAGGDRPAGAMGHCAAA